MFIELTDPFEDRIVLNATEILHFTSEHQDEGTDIALANGATVRVLDTYAEIKSKLCEANLLRP